jgi:hypothetical protein
MNNLTDMIRKQVNVWLLQGKKSGAIEITKKKGNTRTNEQEWNWPPYSFVSGYRYESGKMKTTPGKPSKSQIKQVNTKKE